MSAPTKWQSIQRIATETDTEMSVHVSDHLRKVQTVYSVQLVLVSLTMAMPIHKRSPNHFLSLTLPAVDHSRVKLENTENDYINASLIVMEEAQRSYILTQASIFWIN